MRLLMIAAIAALSACRPGHPDFGSPEVMASSRPLPQAIDCVSGALLNGWGAVSQATAGG